MMSLLNDDQKNAIIDILKEQCRCIQKANALERYMFPNLYDAQYMSGRHHSNRIKSIVHTASCGSSYIVSDGNKVIKSARMWCV